MPHVTPKGCGVHDLVRGTMTRMSTRAASGRPLGVTVVVALTAVVAVLDVVAGTVVLVDAAEGPSVQGLSPEESASVTRVLGVALLALGVLHAIIAVQLSSRTPGPCGTRSP